MMSSGKELIGQWIYNFEMFDINTRFVKCNGADFMCFRPQYDTVSDVVESGVHWGSNFQIGSRVLKNCYKPILMHIYGIQCDFMHRSC